MEHTFRRPDKYSNLSLANNLESETSRANEEVDTATDSTLKFSREDSEEHLYRNENLPTNNSKRSISTEDKCQSIYEALNCMLNQLQEYKSMEEKYVSEISELCTQAKALEARLSSKKALILSHFQQLAMKLDREH
ncbi:unnamed protein product [Calicophoron daubneyi]|uniref:Uncharacterized protein n=1 Tax=Calicophoron daubneyi TaxID=300641 RepID=A0AAV2TCQ5_CALDB